VYLYFNRLQHWWTRLHKGSREQTELLDSEA
jgi:hypothetical protein